MSTDRQNPKDLQAMNDTDRPAADGADATPAEGAGAPPQWTRRETIRNAGVAGAALGLAGCGDEADAPQGFDLSGLPPLPEGLPVYRYDGPLGPEKLFAHGVASGDPLPEAVILWTRVSPADAGPVEVLWEMALDEGFEYRVAAGTETAGPDRDWTVKIDAAGLVWGRKYFYRFHALGRSSPTGRTRLAPKSGDGTGGLRFGVCSCASFADAHYHAYRWLSARRDLDAVIHLGDYIYEYGDNSSKLRRIEPKHEIISLADYRIRYGHYRSDPDLQAVHQWHPFICVWDDHESANNSWREGAQNHQPETEGEWQDRLAAAHRAWMEWLPVRETPAVQDMRIYRTFRYGDLCDLYMLDTRIIGRDREEADVELAALEDRHILGAEQEDWVAAELAAGKARWQVFGQQVVMGWWAPALNPDAWDGYPAARRRFYEIVERHTAEDANFVVLTGDVHTSWAQDLTHDDPREADSYNPAVEAIGCEFVCPGIGSTGFPLEGDGAERAANALVEVAPQLQWCNLWRRGYFVLDIDADRVQADWYLLDGVRPDQGSEDWYAGARWTHGQRGLVMVPDRAPDRPA